jgi:hypothetical protein
MEDERRDTKEKKEWVTRIKQKIWNEDKTLE